MKPPAKAPTPPAKDDGPMPSRVALGMNLRMRRRALKLSQRDLAARTNISQKTIAMIESQSWNATLDTVDTLALHLGCPTIELLLPLEMLRSRR